MCPAFYQQKRKAVNEGEKTNTPGKGNIKLALHTTNQAELYIRHKSKTRKNQSKELM